MRSANVWRGRVLELAVVGAAVTVALNNEEGPAVRRLVVAVLAAAAVLARHRWPVPAMVAVTVALAATVVIGHSSLTFLLLLGLVTYHAMLHTRHRHSWLYAVGAGVLLLAAGLLARPAPALDVWTVASLFAWVCGTGALGDAVRNRRALLDETTERLRQAEQTREEEARRRAMDERLRIARELHDVVAHHIAVMNVQAGAAGHVVEQHPEKAGPVLEVIRQASDNVLREMRSVIGVLRDHGDRRNVEPSPSLSRLDDLVAGLTMTGFRVESRVEGDRRDLPAMVDQAAYRIAQEALTNAHRYGDGSARLTVTYGPQELTIEVTNRVGLPRRGVSGFGLLGMRERAAAVGGTVTAEPAAGGRFVVRTTLPTSAYALEATA
ncbi:two-component sensor histidine kinase [Actinoplanes sp. NBRC 14428]|uniref:sensor histidine kinase n=1 Tax=Pseudosporangium ferrugineum TaxID=439699 RepID=UPI0011B2512A|nr:histidine kinase [Pseudosporangium ferrugineum]BCJ50312.1 two-component sensor histidine kinase [Actinoplanes sp. NBRC 14428]